jgi:predicted dehydrogenase
MRNDRNRRGFLRAAGVAVAGAPPPLAQSAASRSRIVGANDRIRVALIGWRGMGSNDLKNFLSIKNTECVALCDVDAERSAKALKSIVEPLAQSPGLITKDFRRVVELRDLDAVMVATPDHWHALCTVAACQAGKDVYVEKPLSLSIAEGRAMVESARKYNRVVQMGTQQRSAPHYTQAINHVNSGKLGKIRLVRAWAYLDGLNPLPAEPDSAPPPSVDYDMWLGPAPKRPFNKNRFHFNFRWYWDYCGGLMTDWGAHMIDIANGGMGIKAPTSAVAACGKFGYPTDATETPDTQHAIWKFPEFSMIWEHAAGLGRGPEARDHGVAFHGENGLLVVDRLGWEVYAESGHPNGGSREFRGLGVPRQIVYNDDSHQRHVRNFADCVRSRGRPVSEVEIGHNSMIACHLGNIAYRLGCQVNWDVDNEKMINDREAQSYVMREYRDPWKLTL